MTPRSLTTTLCRGLLLGALLAAPAVAQRQAPVFAHLQGRWEGEGTLFGGPARFEMEWTPKHGVVVLTFSNATVDAAGAATPILGAVAIYRTTTAAPRATWEDTRGVQVTITWVATDSVLTSTWTAATESGQTEYAVQPDGTVEVTDHVMRNGELVLFGQATYRRVASRE